nr:MULTISPECIES: integrase core domain-containing protein [unclassified Sphingomonas]
MIVTNNGTEMTSKVVLARSGDVGVEWQYISTEKAIQNGYIGSFSGDMRAELFNETLFFTARQTRPQRAGWTTATPSGRTRRSTTLPRPPSLPGMNSNWWG